LVQLETRSVAHWRMDRIIEQRDQNTGRSTYVLQDTYECAVLEIMSAMRDLPRAMLAP
jgi:hypothetical protein